MDRSEGGIASRWTTDHSSVFFHLAFFIFMLVSIDFPFLLFPLPLFFPSTRHQWQQLQRIEEREDGFRIVFLFNKRNQEEKGGKEKCWIDALFHLRSFSSYFFFCFSLFLNTFLIFYFFFIFSSTHFPFGNIIFTASFFSWCLSGSISFNPSNTESIYIPNKHICYCGQVVDISTSFNHASSQWSIYSSLQGMKDDLIHLWSSVNSLDDQWTNEWATNNSFSSKRSFSL